MQELKSRGGKHKEIRVGVSTNGTESVEKGTKVRRNA